MAESKDGGGFSAPMSPAGAHALYGPPPWHFEGWSASILFEFDPDAVRTLIPEPLSLTGDPTCRLSVHDIICDYGFGREFGFTIFQKMDRPQLAGSLSGMAIKDTRNRLFGRMEHYRHYPSQQKQFIQARIEYPMTGSE